MDFFELKLPFFVLLLDDIVKILFFFDLKERLFLAKLLQEIQKLLLFFLFLGQLSFSLFSSIYISFLQGLMSLFLYLLLKLLVFHCTFNFEGFHLFGLFYSLLL